MNVAVKGFRRGYVASDSVNDPVAETASFNASSVASFNASSVAVGIIKEVEKKLTADVKKTKATEKALKTAKSGK